MGGYKQLACEVINCAIEDYKKYHRMHRSLRGQDKLTYESARDFLLDKGGGLSVYAGIAGIDAKAITTAVCCSGAQLGAEK